jgi:hypothetical protein
MSERRVDLMIVGAQKCATSSLFRELDAHPTMCGASEKEPHYFSTTDNWRAGLAEYHALFHGSGRWFEGSTSYTFYPHRRLELWNDLHDYNPDLRFIYVVREPIARLQSAYLHLRSRGYTSEPFARELFSNCLMLDATRYYLQILPFVERFGRERVLVLEFADLTREREATLAQVASFLGIDTDGFAAEPIHANRAADRRAVHKDLDTPVMRGLRRVAPWLHRHRARQLTPSLERPEVTPELRRAVGRLLGDDVGQLEILMGRDLSAWREAWA